MKSYTFKVPGNPVGKEETQVYTGRKNDGTIFQMGVKPKKTRNFHALVTQVASVQSIEIMPFVTLDVIVALPCTVAKKRKTKPDAWKPKGVRPDSDNVKKIVKDALQGIAYKNDKQVLHDECEYYWLEPDAQPYTLITIVEARAVHYISPEVEMAMADYGIEFLEE